jgi:hypothetical protein
MQLSRPHDFQPVLIHEPDDAAAENASFNIMREIKKAKSQANSTEDFCKKIIPVICESRRNKC